MKLSTFNKWMAGLAGAALMTGSVLAQSSDSGQQTSQSNTDSSSDWGNQNLSGNQSSPGQSYGSQPSGNQQHGNPSWGQQPSGNQQSWSQSSNQSYYGTTQEPSQTGQFSDAKQLLGQEVNNRQGQTLGQIKDLAFNTQNGQVFAVVGIGNNQNALVPIQALNITGRPNNPR